MSDHDSQTVEFPSAFPLSSLKLIGPDSLAVDSPVVEARGATAVRSEVSLRRAESSDRAPILGSEEPGRSRTRQSSEPRGDFEDAVTLRLHGALSRDGAPHLQAVLDGVVLLQPTRLLIDLSDVSYVSPEALTMITTCEVADGDVVVRSPSHGLRDWFMAAPSFPNGYESGYLAE